MAKKPKKNAFQRSAFGKLNLKDLFDAIFYTSLFSFEKVFNFMASGTMPTKLDFIKIGGVFLLGLMWHLSQGKRGVNIEEK